MARHSDLVTTALHEAFHYAQDADPGAVGASKYWLDTNSGPPRKLYRRNAANDGWDEIGGGSGAALTVQEVDGAPLDAAVTIIRVTNGKLTDNGAGDVTLDLTGSGGGAGINSGLYSARPAAGNAGDLYLPTDGNRIYRDDGAAWKGWGPAIPMVDVPAVAGWTWVNQSTATAVDDGQGGIYMAAPVSAGTNLRVLVRSTPATPYKITAVMFGLLHPANQNSCGILHRQSSDGKLRYLQFYYNSAIFVGAANYTTAALFSANVGTQQSVLPLAVPYLLQIEDNGTTVFYRWSHDGVTWIEAYSVARTTFLTPDQVGFAVDASNASNAPAATLGSWKVE